MNQSTRDAFDVVVIGSGPGGYVAALKAQAAGLRTAIVEKDARFGGTCLHVGCIPSKVFLHTASLLDEIRAAKKVGIEVAAPSLDWDGLKRRSRRVIAKLAGGVSLLLKRGGVEAFHGFGRLAGPGRVEVAAPDESGTRRLEARNVIIATGSEARTLPFLPLDGDRIVTNAEMFSLDELPARLGIIGAGAVGAEFASMFKQLRLRGGALRGAVRGSSRSRTPKSPKSWARRSGSAASGCGPKPGWRPPRSRRRECRSVTGQGRKPGPPSTTGCWWRSGGRRARRTSASTPSASSSRRAASSRWTGCAEPERRGSSPSATWSGPRSLRTWRPRRRTWRWRPSPAAKSRRSAGSGCRRPPTACRKWVRWG